MTGTDLWKVPEAGLRDVWWAGGRLELKNIRKW